MARCRSCQKTILWVRSTNTGNLMPVNADPDDAGNVEIHKVQTHPREHGRDGGYVYQGTVYAQPPLAADGTMHMPHHATCPQADQWRSKGRRG